MAVLARDWLGSRGICLLPIGCDHLTSPIFTVSTFPPNSSLAR